MITGKQLFIQPQKLFIVHKPWAKELNTNVIESSKQQEDENPI
jgi:hypothetical protein